MKGLKETKLRNFLNCVLVHICVQQQGGKSYEKTQDSSNLHTQHLTAYLSFPKQKNLNNKSK